MSRDSFPTPCPDFRDDTYENVLLWAGAEVAYSDEFVNGTGETTRIPRLGGWGLLWKHGAIGFCSLRSRDDEAKARKAAALFIHLWSNGVDAGIAERCAEAYVQTWAVRTIQAW